MQKACKQLIDNLSDVAEEIKEDDASKFWAATIAKVHSGVGFAPAMKQLTAVGFFDGTETGGKCFCHGLGIRQHALRRGFNGVEIAKFSTSNV